jgi:hypothetical protein
LDPTDSQEPRTQTYSFTIAERLPWKSLLEVAYVGSKSDLLSNYNNNFDQVNDLHAGALFTTPGTGYGWMPNCNTSTDPKVDSNSCAHSGANTGYNTGDVNNARPLYSGACVAAKTCLGTLKIIDHKMYSNYNGLQITWNKQAGPLIFLTNYTFSKALGIRGENGSQVGDPTVLGNNYGTLPNNRTHLFNVAYVYTLPKFAKSGAFMQALANGWEVSGTIQYQSGADLQAAVTQNFNYSAFFAPGSSFMGKTLSYTDSVTGAVVPYTVQASISNTAGSPDLTLMPTLVCDPRSHLTSNQYINGVCFSPYAVAGKQGNYIFPTLTGPGFFNTDMSIFKNFTFGQSENKKLSVRLTGYNFINHPNNTFIANDNGLNLTFNSAGQLNSQFGYATNTIGHRIVQIMVRFAW